MSKDMTRTNIVIPRSVVAATAGALKSDMLPLSPEEERQPAEQAIADDVIERMNRR
jgi:hypothetical protein